LCLQDVAHKNPGGMGGKTAEARRPALFLAVFASTIATLAAQVVYVYFVRLRQFVHSDAAALVLLGKSAIDAHAIIPTRWYWGNGDVWLFAAPIVAGPVALFGVGLETLRIVDVLVFLLELCALTYLFRLLSKSTIVSVLAAAVTLLGISRLHLLFVYVELAYGFIAAQFFAIPVLVATAARAGKRKRTWAVPLSLAFLLAACNPTRFLVCGLAPLLLATAWPWRGVMLRRRATIGALLTASWVLAWATYRFAFPRLLTFAPGSGHAHFVVADLAGMVANIGMIGRGLIALSGNPGELRLAVIPGLLFVLAAIVLVAFHVFEDREPTPLRFVGLVQLAQLGALAVPMIVGNLMLNPLSGRYLMPALLPIFGISVVVAHDALGTRGTRRIVSMVWLALAPAMGLLALGRMIGASLEAANAQWSNRSGHLAVAKELAARGLRHGFASYWHANLVTLLSNGRVRTCPVSVGDEVYPYKWGVDSGCFERSNIGDRVYFVAAAEERVPYASGVMKTFGPAVDRFEAGGFEVSIFESASLEWGWLALPLPSGDAIRFPLVLSANHPAIRRGNVARSDRSLVATGKEGNLVFGPYLDLPAGDYTARWFGRGIASPGDIAFDAFAQDTGHLGDFRVPAKDLVGRDELASVSFTLPGATRGVELRVHADDGARVELRELRIERR
jgi:hypothetical protein